MKIRSITYFMNVGWPLNEAKIQTAGAFLKQARAIFEEAGYEVQTTRLASTPFSSILGPDSIGLAPRMAQKLNALIQTAGIDYAALGPALADVPESYEMIPDAIGASKNIFFCGEMATPEKGISLAAIRACAQVIVRNAEITGDGFANLRFAAIANVSPGGPFFPGAYHDSDQPTFALAIECADLAVTAFENAKTIEEGRKALAAELETHGRKLATAAEPLKYQFSIRFGGIDFSLAPFPKETQSLGAAMERIGVPKVGLSGSLTAAAILTDSIDRADFPRAGFCGFMAPVLEDAILAKRAAGGTLTVRDLLLYSTVCGTGLDTIPLPGDVSADQVAALLLDIAALSLRLNKPLTARLMPVPGKKAGDATDFNFDYFANSKVLALEAEGLGKLLAGDEVFSLGPKK
jgi:uncharacterized protein (UPF0210 family)